MISINDYGKQASTMYQRYVISDIFDTFRNIHKLWEFQDYITVFSVYSISRYIIHYPSKQSLSLKPLSYNKYISKGIASIHNRSLLRLWDIHEDELWYKLYQRFILAEGISLRDVCLKMDEKCMRFVCHTFEHFYNLRLTPKKLIKYI